MMSFIEGPYTDEPLFSLLGRNYSRLVGVTRTKFSQHLFGTRLVIPFDFPCGIDALERTIGSQVGLTATDLIHKHTMFPLAAFLSKPERAEHVMQAMRGNMARARNLPKWRRNHADDGLRHLKFCEECRAADWHRYRRTWARSWWRRTHQVPGVVCCHVHGTALQLSQFVPGQLWDLDYPVADKAVSVGRMPAPDGIDLLYARDVHWVLENKPQSIDPVKLRVLYQTQLGTRGLLVDGSGQLRRTEFQHRFFAQRSEEEWRQRNLHFDPDDPSAWPAQTVKGKENHSSFRAHFLVMRFLGIAVPQIHDLLAGEATVQIVNKRTGETQTRRELRRLWSDKKWTLRALHQHLGIGRARMLRLAWEEKLSLPRFKDKRAGGFVALRKKYRAVYLKEQRSRSPLWHKARRWLARCDRTWFLKRRKAVRQPARERVDWKARELDLIAQLPRYEARIAAARPFRRICAAAFITLMPYGLANPKVLKRKMRGLADAIRDRTETTDEFTLRRVVVTRRLYPEMTPYEVREKASVRRDCRNPKVLLALGYRFLDGRWISGRIDHSNYGLRPDAGDSENSTKPTG